jgi:hypothetical protein
LAVQTVVTGNSTATISFTEVDTTGLISQFQLNQSDRFSPTYANAASGAINTIDLCYAKQLTLSSSITLNLLSGMSTLGGTSASFARVRELWIRVVDTTPGHYVNVFAASSSGWTVGLPLQAEQLTIPPGGLLHLSDPLSFGVGTGLYVPAGSGTFTMLANTSGTVVNVIITGCSVA